MLAPESPSDALDGYRLGEIVTVEIKQIRGRSAGLHRKFWALMQVLRGYWQDDNPPPLDLFRKWVTMRAGWLETLPGGYQVPRSIAFRNMEQQEFEQLYSACVDFALQTYLPTSVDRDALDAEVENLMLGFG
jgi:hypothetical protein